MGRASSTSRNSSAIERKRRSVDDLRAALWRAKKPHSAIAAVRGKIMKSVADRLQELGSYGADVEGGQDPLNLKSAQWFLDYSVRAKFRHQPILAMTREGMVEATWKPDTSRTLVLRVFDSGRAWLLIRTPELKGSWEMNVADLLSNRIPIEVPDWAR